MPLLNVAATAVGSAAFLLMVWFAVVSLTEEERRAASRAIVTAVLLPIPYLLVGLLPTPRTTALGVVFLAAAASVAVTVLLPLRTRKLTDEGTPISRIDERDTMFSRNALEPGSERFRDYYSRNPDKKEPDDRFREKPGLLKDGTTWYDPYLFPAAEASFATVKLLHPILDQEPAVWSQASPDPSAASNFLKAWARKLGALSVGVTELMDYHLYSHIGRGERYGERVALKHRYAVALTVEMDKGMLDRAPLGPVVMESAQQYLVSGAIAVQMAEFMRSLGFSSRAHIDGNYRVVAPLVARDAGLGEVGRMGLLMTPELGPRVRIAVVTTDLSLVPEEAPREPSTIDFCTRCRKCAEACPAGAIPFGDRAEIDGVRRWRIDAAACFTYWRTVGTDCARCIRVCPYSHPSSLLHNLVRRGIRNSRIFSALALRLDDFFYGRRPGTRPLPDWMALRSGGAALGRSTEGDGGLAEAGPPRDTSGDQYSST
jgi:reductive dehalogenase